MADLNPAVMKGFALTARFLKKEKMYYICETPEGLKKIYKTADTAEKIHFQHTVKEHCWDGGYVFIDRFTLSASGQPYFTADGENFVMTPHVKSRETDFTSWDDVKQALEAAARFHAQARHVPLDGSPVAPPAFDAYLKKQLAELNMTAKRVRKQPRLSDFDVLFIKNIHFYTEQLKDAITRINQTDYAQRVQTACAETHICHNALKEENLLLDNNNTHLHHFSCASVDAQLNDIAAFIRRYAQRAGREAVPAARLVEAYDRVIPLSGAELEIIYALLLYPLNFIKIVGQYYSKKRSWTPNAIINRMLSAVDEKDFYAGYIEGLR